MVAASTASPGRQAGGQASDDFGGSRRAVASEVEGEENEVLGKLDYMRSVGHLKTNNGSMHRTPK